MNRDDDLEFDEYPAIEPFRRLRLQAGDTALSVQYKPNRDVIMFHVEGVDKSAMRFATIRPREFFDALGLDLKTVHLQAETFLNNTAFRALWVAGMRFRATLDNQHASVFDEIWGHEISLMGGRIKGAMEDRGWRPRLVRRNLARRSDIAVSPPD